jgi:hypothetical protein
MFNDDEDNCYLGCKSTRKSAYLKTSCPSRVEMIMALRNVKRDLSKFNNENYLVYIYIYIISDIFLGRR